MTVTPNASGEYVWTFPQAFTAGTVPVVVATPEQPSGTTYKLDAVLKAGTVSATSCTIIINRINNNVVVGLLNAVLGIITPQTTSTVVHLWARKPTT